MAEFVEDIDFGENPGNLTMSLQIPDEAVNGFVDLPVVIALHGCSQNSQTMAEQSGWSELAKKYGFMVLYPEQRRVNNGSNCFNWFELDDIEPGTGEMQSIANMLFFLKENYAVDTNRVFVYGLSAGGAMGVSLMANYPNLFQAGAIFAGGAHKLATTKGEGFKAMLKPVDRSPQEWGDLVGSTDSINYPKIIIFHGEKDKTVAIENAYELIEQWTYLHKIDTIPDQTIIGFERAEDVNRIAYMDTLGNERVLFFKIANLGHALPVNPGSGKAEGGKTGIFAKDIDFFSTYYVAKQFGLF